MNTKPMLEIKQIFLFFLYNVQKFDQLTIQSVSLEDYHCSKSVMLTQEQETHCQR